MNPLISLENIRSFGVPLQNYPLAWMFDAGDGRELPPEFLDQIIPLQPDAAVFLWNYECMQKTLAVHPTHFKTCETFRFAGKSDAEVKKWLYQREIPFHNEVFWTYQPQQAIILTWKIVIKFWEPLFFGRDERIWDRTLNWSLESNHNEVFYFGKDRIYNNLTQYEEEQEKLRIVEQAIREGRNRATKTVYGKNPYTK